VPMLDLELQEVKMIWQHRLSCLTI
jgi:hypothetical protein